VTPALESSIARVRAAVVRAVFASTLCAWAAGLAFGLGCVVLIARTSIPLDASRAAWILAGLALAPLIAWRVASKKRPSDSAAAAWLDVRSGASGSIVTGFEVADDAWRARVDEALARVEGLPAARLKRPLTLCLVGVAFALATVLTPIPKPPPGPNVVLQQARVERVEEQLATLEEEITLAPEFAEEMRANLERLKEEDALANQESALEATDRASERLADEAEASADAAESVLAGIEAAAANANSDPDAAQKAVEEALAQLTKSGLAKGLEDELAKQLGLESLELPPGTKLDVAKFAGLSKSLEGALGEKLAKLAAKGLLKEGRFARGEKPGDDPEFAEHVCTPECAKNPGGT